MAITVHKKTTTVSIPLETQKFHIQTLISFYYLGKINCLLFCLTPTIIFPKLNVIIES